LEGYVVFMKSLLLHNPGFNYPMLLMEKLNGIPVRDETRSRLKKLYPQTYFIEPMLPSIIPYSKYFAYGSGHDGSQFSNENTTQLFYRRLQLFTYSFCRKVVHLDAADMLVNGNVTEMFDDVYTQDSGFAAAKLCTQRWYFNAGLYVVGPQQLTQETYANLVRTATAMPRPISARHGPWFADQDVLNLWFGGANNTCLTLPHKLNYSKRFVYWWGAKTYSRLEQLWAVTDKMKTIGNCVSKTPPVIVHYV